MRRSEFLASLLAVPAALLAAKEAPEEPGYVRVTLAEQAEGTALAEQAAAWVSSEVTFSCNDTFAAMWLTWPDGQVIRLR